MRQRKNVINLKVTNSRNKVNVSSHSTYSSLFQSSVWSCAWTREASRLWMLSPFLDYFNYVPLSSIHFAVFIYLFRRLCVFCCHLPHINYCPARAVCSAELLLRHPSMFSQRSPFCWLRYITRSVFRELVWQQEWERKRLKIWEEPEGGGGKK